MEESVDGAPKLRMARTTTDKRSSHVTDIVFLCDVNFYFI